ncbi:lipopolysaccharide biosynthesis protein [Rhodoferax sp. U2-2l]|uniref:lipopolysaccharide biosynthesis protein n=1 Tax=Rhodoferax sp. U2-2l TaxID=2884000 RepID=UPI001D0ADC93|nr:lipopolysaccharide biosynthesis protein [Rhodoferax sp. U2-2l]MCB8746896.1 lipopolysaccharide biosynthesis protein [Rhodoferax sp. U2-2l]
MTKNITIRQIGRGAFWSLINQSVGQFLVLFVFLVTARFVSKVDFGIMAMAMLAIELFRQVLIESVGTTFYAKKSPTNSDYSAGFFVILTGGLLSGVLIFFSAKSLALFFGHADLETTLQWISVLLLTTGLSKMHEIWLTKHLRFKMLAIRSILSIGIGGAVGIVMAVRGYGIDSLIAQQIVTALISAVWLWASCAWRPDFDFKRTDVVAIIQYGKFVSLNSTANFLGGQSDVALSSYYLGAAATGVYNAAKRLLTAIALIVGSGLNSVALPALAAISDDAEKLKRSFLMGVGLTALLTAPIYAALAVLSLDVIHILLGPNWSDAAPVLAILSIIGFTRMVTQYSTNILLIKQKVHWQTALSFVDAGLNVVFLMVFAKYGLIYLAWAFVAKTIIVSPIVTALALNLLKMRWTEYLKVVSLPIVLSLVAAGLVHSVRQNIPMPSYVSVLIFVPLGGLIYVLSYYVSDRKSFIQFFGFLKITMGKVN